MDPRVYVGVAVGVVALVIVATIVIMFIRDKYNETDGVEQQMNIDGTNISGENLDITFLAISHKNYLCHHFHHCHFHF